jgi:hypothetical protein
VEVILNAKYISSIVNAELGRIHDDALSVRIRELLVAPYPVERGWDYGAIDEHYTCWTVLEHPSSNTGIAFCLQGFGPSDPWGLVALYGEHMSIGMDSAWHPTLEAAMRESMAWDGSTPEGYEVP